MFSGIIQQVGELQVLYEIKSEKKLPKKTPNDKNDFGLRVLITCSLKLFPKLTIGESIAVDGVCLTVVKINKNGFEVEVSPETINVCKQKHFSENGNQVNLERAMRYGDVVGGHLVSGHIDGVGNVSELKKNNEFTLMTFTVPKKINKYLVNKGCIAVNGVSLTVNKVGNKKFTVMLIPHTLLNTNLGALKVGDEVNLESDLLARYVIGDK